jgi:hypothetical protein
MYLRTIQRRNKDGSVVRYLQLAHNERHPESGHSVAKVVHSFGREDQLDRDALARLVASISRFLSPEEALEAGTDAELRFEGSRPMGGAWLLDGLWRKLGIDTAIQAVAAGRKVDAAATERLLFALVAQRALEPGSKLAAIEWANHDVALPGIDDVGEDPQVFYGAMDFLLEADEAIQRAVFAAAANLLNLEVDLLFFDTTSTYFETEHDDELRRYGHSKDHRDDRPQAIIGMAVTREGIPVRVWTFPGNTADVSLLEGVKADLRDWQLGRVVWVVDRGFASAANRGMLQRGGHHWIMGEKLRTGGDNHEALARPGRYRTVAEGLEVKTVIVDHGTFNERRFIVCRNLAEAERDRHRREQALARLDTELAAIAHKTGDARLRAEGELAAHPTLRRYLTRRGKRLVIDRGKARTEARLDGKYLLSCSDATLPADDVALGYKQLLAVERGWRDMKQVLELRPVYHRLDERIQAHVLLCWLALLLIRVAETECGDTWRNLRRELERMHLGEFTGPAGRVVQRTETSPAQAATFRALDLAEPPKILHLDTAQDSAA